MQVSMTQIHIGSAERRLAQWVIYAVLAAPIGVNRDCPAIAGCRKRHVSISFLDYEEFIGAKKHLVLGLLSHTG
jgi:hypothetical protein